MVCIVLISTTYPALKLVYMGLGFREEHDILNWILDESGHFTLKSAMNFFLQL